MNLQLHDQQHPPNVSIFPPQAPKPQQPNSPLQMYLNSNVPHPTNTLPAYNNDNTTLNNHQLQPSAIANAPFTTPIVVTAVPIAIAPPAIVSPTTPTPIIISNRIHPSNDMNDAFNISKILQSSISNGTGSNSTISTNSNLTTSPSNDKRAHDSIKFNSKTEETTKDTKQNRQSKNKKDQKVPAVRPAPAQPPPAVNVNNQHKHVNGDVKVKNCKKLNNHHQNGDDVVYSEEQLKKWEKSNQETKVLVDKEIKKFGRDYSGLFIQLEKIKGHFELQNSFIQSCIAQCLRYKRQTMAKSIEDWWEKRHVCKNGNSKKNGSSIDQQTATATGKFKI